MRLAFVAIFEGLGVDPERIDTTEDGAVGLAMMQAREYTFVVSAFSLEGGMHGVDMVEKMRAWEALAKGSWRQQQDQEEEGRRQRHQHIVLLSASSPDLLTVLGDSVGVGARTCTVFEKAMLVGASGLLPKPLTQDAAVALVEGRYGWPSIQQPPLLISNHEMRILIADNCRVICGVTRLMLLRFGCRDENIDIVLDGHQGGALARMKAREYNLAIVGFWMGRGLQVVEEMRAWEAETAAAEAKAAGWQVAEAEAAGWKVQQQQPIVLMYSGPVIDTVMPAPTAPEYTYTPTTYRERARQMGATECVPRLFDAGWETIKILLKNNAYRVRIDSN